MCDLTIAGDASELAGTPERQAILDVLNLAPEGLRAREIAERLQKNLHTLRNLLVKLRLEGKIILHNEVYCLVKESQRSQNVKEASVNGSIHVVPDALHPLPDEERALTVVTASQPGEPSGEPDASEGQEPPDDALDANHIQRNVARSRALREVGTQLYQRLLKALEQHPDQQSMIWNVKGSIYPHGEIPLKEYKRRVRAELAAGGEALPTIIAELRAKLLLFEQGSA